MGLARTAFLTGETDLALETVEEILRDKDIEAWHDQSRDLRREIVEGEPLDAAREAWRRIGDLLIDALAPADSAGTAGASLRRRTAPFPRSRLPEVESLVAGSEGDPVAAKLLGDAYLLAGLPAKALETYDRALPAADRPSLWAVHMQIRLNRVHAMDLLQRNRNARDELKEALDRVAKPDLLRYPLESRVESSERRASR
jgi:hypothetical protein